MKKHKKLTLEERTKIQTGLSKGKSKADIARRINRSKSTITRELVCWGNKDYDAQLAHWLAEEKRHNYKKKKLDSNDELLKFVTDSLRNNLSPEQISNRLKKDYPNNYQMNISHESIYKYIYIFPKGGLRKELISYLRQQKKKRYNKRGSLKRTIRIPDRICIDQRPAEVDDRVIPGHWESDLIIGKDKKSAIGTIVERTTRFVIIVPLKNRTAPYVRKAFARELNKFPEHLRLTMTHDNGLEMADHKTLTKKTNIQVFFAHPYSSWERGTNENTNGLIRQYFPKDTDFNKVSTYTIKKAQNQLNIRPRKVIDWATPNEAMSALLFA